MPPSARVRFAEACELRQACLAYLRSAPAPLNCLPQAAGSR